MKWFFKRLREGSSQAGIGLVLSGVAGLMTNRADPVAWGQVVAGVGAVIRPDGAGGA